MTAAVDTNEGESSRVPPCAPPISNGSEWEKAGMARKAEIKARPQEAEQNDGNGREGCPEIPTETWQAVSPARYGGERRRDQQAGSRWVVRLSSSGVSVMRRRLASTSTRRRRPRRRRRRPPFIIRKATAELTDNDEETTCI